MKHLYLVRHGNQNTNLFNEDADLSEKGRRQAELLRDRIRGWHFDKIYSSVLRRAVQTSDILNSSWHMDIERRAELNEMDWGRFTLCDIEKTNEEFRDFFDMMSRGDEDIPYPDGENGEMAFLRAYPVFSEIERSGFSSVLIVCHGGLIRSVLAGLLGIPFERKVIFSRYLENTSISELLYDEERHLYTLERLNDFNHLSPYPELQRSRR